MINTSLHKRTVYTCRQCAPASSPAFTNASHRSNLIHLWFILNHPRKTKPTFSTESNKREHVSWSSWQPWLQKHMFADECRSRGRRAWLAAHLASLPVTWAVDTYELQHQSPSHHLINSFTFTQQSSSHFKPLWLIWRRCFMSVLEWKVIYEAQHASLIVIKHLNAYLFFFPLSLGCLKLLVWWRILPDLCRCGFLLNCQTWCEVQARTHALC